MSIITLYHGSPEVVRKPELVKGKAHNDFGQGFYCTEHQDLAMEWACTAGRGGFANRYLLDVDRLELFDLAVEEYRTLRWLALLLQHRRVRLSTPIMRRAKDWVIQNFSVDLSPFDVVKGYRADDSYFGFARAFLNNAITVEQLSFAMRLGSLGEQYVLKSQQAFEAIEFIDTEPADQTVYYARRLERDEQARRDFNTLLEQEDRGGITIRQLIDGEIGLDDERIQ